MEFSEKLILLRKSRGLSQEELGFALGVTRQTISKWELNETSPDLRKAKSIADFFGVSVGELLGDEEERSTGERRVKGKNRYEYEYVSERKVNGLPLVHIHFGIGRCHAKGIIAIGNVARGVVAIGGAAVGIFAVGGVAFGLLSLGGLALGLLFALGGVAAGSVALGGICLGMLAIGGIALGWFSVGGLAVGNYAIGGGLAQAREIAFGAKAYGAVTFPTGNGIVYTAEEIRKTILQSFPELSPVILNIFTLLGR